MTKHTAQAVQVKKSASRTTKKRSSTKKATKPTAHKSAKVAREHYFVRMDGVLITSLVDLAKQIDEMSDQVFYHHVTADRNDFAAWIADVIKDDQLATDLGYIKDRHATAYAIMRKIVHQL